LERGIFFAFENSCSGCEECMFWLEEVVLLIECGKSFKKFETLFIKKVRAAPKGSAPLIRGEEPLQREVTPLIKE